MKIVGLKEGATLTSEVGIYTRIRDVARPQPNNLIYDNSSNPDSQRHLMKDGLQFTRAGVGRLALVLVTMVIMSLRRGETCCWKTAAHDRLSKDHKRANVSW